MSEKQKTTAQDETRSALSRLLVVLVVTIGLFIYAYGWTVTEIDLSEPQEEQRQESVSRALRELLSPRIFEQERALTQYEAAFLMDCTTGDAPVQAASDTDDIVVILEPACADANEEITLRLLNGPVGADARLRWVPPVDENGEVGNVRPLEIIETGREDLVLDAAGGFEGTIEVPRIRRGEGEIHTLRVLVAIPNGPIEFSETALLVIDRMIQTIFMALVATTVAIPIAAFISFFAAYNLMRRVRLTVGSILMAFLLFVVGIWVGSSFVSFIGEWGIMVGRGELFAPIGALLAFAIPIIVIVATTWVLAQLQDNTGKRSPQMNLTTQILNTLISSAVVIFLIGALGGLGILGGEQISALAESIRPAEVSGIPATLQDGLGASIGYLGNFLLILSELIELGIGVVAGVVTGFAFAGIGASVFGNQLRRLRGSISHIIAAIVGAIAGAVLLGLLATVALWASLLAILPLLIGSLLGASVLRQIVGIFFDRNATPVDGIIIKSAARKTVELIIFWIGFAGVFIMMFNAMNVARSLVDGTLPPQTLASIFGIELPITVYVYTAMLFGAVLAGLSAGLSGLHGVFPLGNLLYNTSRTSLNVVRSIEPLIMGLVFVIWVGIGPFAGVLALTLHSIAALGKLYSEQIENIDPGPIEALESTGANQLQTIIYAVVPQIIPPYIAFTMYRWDINVRMSTIIGFVGGGGIGLLLNQQINLLRYRDAGVAVLAIAIVVSVLDYASAYIRERVL